MSDISSVDLLAFVVLPYVAVALFVVGAIARFRGRPYSISSGSSQFLENRSHFWALVPFHYGLLAVLAAHVVAFAMPAWMLAWNASPRRLYALEAAGLALGLLAFAGLAAAVVRRAAVGRVRATTRAADWIVYAVLLLQLATGVAVAIGYRWGSSWFAAVAAPYLWSLVLFRPDPAAIAVLPLGVKLHVLGGFVLAGVFSFSRLAHALDVPNSYFWRRPQIVRWRRTPPRRMEA